MSGYIDITTQVCPSQDRVIFVLTLLILPLWSMLSDSELSGPLGTSEGLSFIARTVSEKKNEDLLSTKARTLSMNLSSASLETRESYATLFPCRFP